MAECCRMFGRSPSGLGALICPMSLVELTRPLGSLVRATPSSSDASSGYQSHWEHYRLMTHCSSGVVNSSPSAEVLTVSRASGQEPGSNYGQIAKISGISSDHRGNDPGLQPEEEHLSSAESELTEVPRGRRSERRPHCDPPGMAQMGSRANWVWRSRATVRFPPTRQLWPDLWPSFSPDFDHLLQTSA